MNHKLELDFVEYNLAAFLDACFKLVQQGKKAIKLRPFNQFAASFANKASVNGMQAKFYSVKEDCEIPPPKNVELCSEDIMTDATILFIPDAKTLSSHLLVYLDLKSGSIIAPITQYYYKNKPLFLISIPKSGTHLLYQLVEAFGYEPGIICPDHPSPGTWYCIEYSNSHTSARDFFIDTVRRSPFGNRHHPFPRSPAIFIYRNPLDILVSEAHYYHQDGKTLFHGYLSKKSFEERLLTLINDPWLLGSIRDRVGNFVAWLDFQNVIPISFEELVGPNGGGSIQHQTLLIWSMQLKLHIPGNPRDFGDKVFNKRSPTFHEGRIGSHAKYFTNKAYEKFYELPQDFMTLLGYDFDHRNNPRGISKRADEFRRRPLIYSESDFENTPILIERYYNGHNIVKYKGLYYGIPCSLGDLRLELQEESFLKTLVSDKELTELKQKIVLRRYVPSYAWKFLRCLKRLHKRLGLI
nr:hypothetical protein [Desulfobacterales bacterium]